MVAAVVVPLYVVLLVDEAAHVRFEGPSRVLDGLHLLVKDVAIDVLSLEPRRSHQRILVRGVRTAGAASPHPVGALVLHAWLKAVIQQLVVLIVF